jgi:DNA-binding response OmpR family regulator
MAKKERRRARRRVLVVEDDSAMRREYARFFEEFHRAEFRAEIVADAEAALGVLRREAVDAVLLDWGLPGISGPQLAKALRADPSTRAIAVLMVTGRGGPSATVHALESGADDHIEKPFDWSVLLARLRSVLRRRELALERRAAEILPGFELDVAAGRLRLDGVVVPLTAKELTLIEIFAARAGVVHSRAFLWDAAWGREAEGWGHTLMVTLSSLRRKMGPKWGPLLQARRGRGYVFSPRI